MSITLGNLTLPDNLVWEDELDWDPVAQTADYSLAGALVVEESTRLAGRPITLRGGPHWVWMTRTALLALVNALDDPGVELTLTLHDARTFQVTARREGERGPVTAQAVPAVLDSGPADPASGTKYWVDAIRLMEV